MNETASSHRYALADPGEVFSPSLLFYKGLIDQNLAEAIRIVGGDPSRLRPHVKTHKTREIVEAGLGLGITKHKCATIAEAEMLARSEVPDILIAYPMVGPNLGRLARLVAHFPGTRFRVLADHPSTLRGISGAMAKAGTEVDVLVDLNVGMRRTGIVPGPGAIDLYRMIEDLPGVVPGGLQAYDGHNFQSELGDRKAAVAELMGPVLALRADLESMGLPVPRLVCGGTPTFPAYASLNIPSLECSPGTFVLSDHTFATQFADLGGFTPAAALITRVISRTGPDLLTIDLGHKAVSGDLALDRRLSLVGLPQAEMIQQSEEHLLVRTPEADRFAPGDVLYAIPGHVCPTVALHKQAFVVEGGRIVGAWDIASRDRFLTF
ncbi:D-TA family PLP-dependent enzyme [Tundrisphaera lichenicola]|uniref:D-TA family PLP-dependent enzyme n=1 Tax=Tundrisphaera lichenicola TaxID=2029860 RepID=UPI003EB7836F